MVNVSLKPTPTQSKASTVSSSNVSSGIDLAEMANVSLKATTTRRSSMDVGRGSGEDTLAAVTGDLRKTETAQKASAGTNQLEIDAAEIARARSSLRKSAIERPTDMGGLNEFQQAQQSLRTKEDISAETAAQIEAEYDDPNSPFKSCLRRAPNGPLSLFNSQTGQSGASRVSSFATSKTAEAKGNPGSTVRLTNEETFTASVADLNPWERKKAIKARKDAMARVELAQQQAVEAAQLDAEVVTSCFTHAPTTPARAPHYRLSNPAAFRHIAPPRAYLGILVVPSV